MLFNYQRAALPLMEPLNIQFTQFTLKGVGEALPVTTSGRAIYSWLAAALLNF
jgi:hypothetical protein